MPNKGQQPQRSPHDMRVKHNKEKMYGTVANRNAVHPPEKSKPVQQSNDTKKEGENV
jgi:hypothetical protein